MTSEELMAYTIELGRKAMTSKSGRPFAAVIAKDGKIVGEGASQSALIDPTAHGEFVAIRDACQKLGTNNLKGCELYTSCEPCLLCVAAIWAAKLDRVYYAFTLEGCEKIGLSMRELADELARPTDARKTPYKQMMAASAGKLFEEWTALPTFPYKIP
jgi:guanine deaminase